MTLKDFKDYIESFENGTIFNYCISNPFSWRGSYNEVAFCINKELSTRELILENINKAYSNMFYGYKGGEYRYSNNTFINFEEDSENYTDGDYCSEMIIKLECSIQYTSQEERLVKLAFKN